MRRSINEIRGEGLIYKDPKTEDSQRTVDFDEDVSALLKRYFKKQFRYYNKEKIVFLHKHGRKIRPNLLTKKLKRKVKKIVKSKARFHDIRHTHTSWLLQLGENPKVVQEKLDHHDVL